MKFFEALLIASKQLPFHDCRSQRQKFTVNFSCKRLRLFKEKKKNKSTLSSTAKWKSGQRCTDVQSIIWQ